MLKILLLYTLIMASFSAPQSDPVLNTAPDCDKSICTSPDCRCASVNPPDGIELHKIPQFLFLTFDDAIQPVNWETYSSLFYNRTNPDGCPLSATFFMTHEWTDYTKVHDLYIHNQEIALHSVSHDPGTDYWKNIFIDDLIHEFGDEKIIISKFANIPEEELQGMRVPYLQLSGDNTFQAGKDIGISYDCTWPTQIRNPGLWPYTLDYKSTQECPIGPCPKSSIPGFWVFPMIDWVDQQNILCSMVDSCINIPSNVEDLTQWFIDNFNVQYKGNRAPFGYYVHFSYFNANPIHLEAYKKFIDYLQSLDDVYIVSIGKALEWIKNPVPIGSTEWPTCSQINDLGCEVNTCALAKGDEIRYMTLCGTCPDVYPWLGNPTGEAQ